MRYKLRKPWYKMVDVPLEKEIYFAIRQSMLEDLLRENTERIKEMNDDESVA